MSSGLDASTSSISNNSSSSISAGHFGPWYLTRNFLATFILFLVSLLALSLPLLHLSRCCFRPALSLSLSICLLFLLFLSASVPLSARSREMQCFTSRLVKKRPRTVGARHAVSSLFPRDYSTRDADATLLPTPYPLQLTVVNDGGV